MDLQNQLFINTSIFKENLKLIVGTLIESIWKEKVMSDKIKETIQAAYNQIYRGSFDEIKELDEEQMYNSWMNSGNNTERLKSEPTVSSAPMGKNEFRDAKQIIKVFEKDEPDAEPQLLISDIYERPANDNEFQTDKIERMKCIEKVDPKIAESTNDTIDDEIDANRHNGTRGRTRRSDSEKRSKVKVFDIKDPYETERWNTDYGPDDHRAAHINKQNDDNSSSEMERSLNRHRLPASMLKEHRKMYMRSFEKMATFTQTKPHKLSTFREKIKQSHIKPPLTGKDSKKSTPFLREQYHTNIQNNVKRDKKHHSTRIEATDMKNKHTNNYSSKDYNLKLSFQKMHARNRSANSNKSKNQLEDLLTTQIEFVKTSEKKASGNDGQDFVFQKNEIYRS